MVPGLCLLTTASIDPGEVPRLKGKGPEQGQASGQPELPMPPEMAQDGDSRSLCPNRA